MANCSKTPVVHETQCKLYVIEIHVIYYCWKLMCHKYDKCNVTVYDMLKYTIQRTILIKNENIHMNFST